MCVGGTVNGSIECFMFYCLDLCTFVHQFKFYCNLCISSLLPPPPLISPLSFLAFVWFLVSLQNEILCIWCQMNNDLCVCFLSCLFFLHKNKYKHTFPLLFKKYKAFCLGLFLIICLIATSLQVTKKMRELFPKSTHEFFCLYFTA